MPEAEPEIFRQFPGHLLADSGHFTTVSGITWAQDWPDWAQVRANSEIRVNSGKIVRKLFKKAPRLVKRTFSPAKDSSSARDSPARLRPAAESKLIGQDRPVTGSFASEGSIRRNLRREDAGTEFLRMEICFVPHQTFSFSDSDW